LTISGATLGITVIVTSKVSAKSPSDTIIINEVSAVPLDTICSFEPLTVVVKDSCNADTSSFIVAVYVCGDVNCDCVVNLLDITYLISYLYKGGPVPCPEHIFGDINGDGTVNILDITYLIAYLYKGGNPPVCPANWPPVWP